VVSVFLSKAKKNVSNHEDRKITPRLCARLCRAWQGERCQKIILLKVFFIEFALNSLKVFKTSQCYYKEFGHKINQKNSLRKLSYAKITLE